MSDSEAMVADEAALFGALRGELPDAAEMEARVRERLAGRAPQGVVLRMADWLGIRERAASIAGPVLMSMGLARKEALGVLVAKAALPKSALSIIALPFAVLLVIGLTLNMALRKTTRLHGAEAKDVDADEAIAEWWSERLIATAIIVTIFAAFHLASPTTAAMLLYLMGLVAHALSAEHLSNGGKASRRAIARSGANITLMMFFTESMAKLPSELKMVLSGWSAEEPPFDQSLLPQLIWHMFALTLGIVSVASLQDRSSLLRPWKLLTTGTHLDLYRAAGFLAIVVAGPIFLVMGYHYLQQLEGSLGERIWANRALLALMAFCLHTVMLVRRAPYRAP